MKAKDAAGRDAVLRGMFSADKPFVPDSEDAYRRLAARARGIDGPDDDADDAAVAAGLLLQRVGPAPAPLPRAAWSLSRLQLAAWFTFAILATIFLWLVHWDFPALSGSLLAVLGIATASSGASMVATGDLDTEQGTVSRGLFDDILGGFDAKRHVHRHQCVVVNAMLLVAGVLSVTQTLALPTFGTTWLAFLGLSGEAGARGR